MKLKPWQLYAIVTAFIVGLAVLAWLMPPMLTGYAGQCIDVGCSARQT